MNERQLTNTEVGMILVGLQRYGIYCEDRAREYEYHYGHGMSWAVKADMIDDLCKLIASADVLTITSNEGVQR